MKASEHTHTHTCTHTDTCTHTYTCTHMHTHMHTHTRTRTHTHMHTPCSASFISFLPYFALARLLIQKSLKPLAVLCRGLHQHQRCHGASTTAAHNAAAATFVTAVIRTTPTPTQPPTPDNECKTIHTRRGGLCRLVMCML